MAREVTTHLHEHIPSDFEVLQHDLVQLEVLHGRGARLFIDQLNKVATLAVVIEAEDAVLEDLIIVSDIIGSLDYSILLHLGEGDLASDGAFLGHICVPASRRADQLVADIVCLGLELPLLRLCIRNLDCCATAAATFCFIGSWLRCRDIKVVKRQGFLGSDLCEILLNNVTLGLLLVHLLATFSEQVLLSSPLLLLLSQFLRVDMQTASPDPVPYLLLVA